jgi:hypothetical protein
MKRAIFLAVVLSLTATSMARADLLYAITFGDEFLSINPSTGAGSLIGYLDSSMAAFGLADRGTSIYTYDQTAYRIRQLDPATGDTLATIDIGVSTTGEGSIAFRSDGIGFMTQNLNEAGTLWNFDIIAPSSTAITSPGGLSPSIDGLDFDGKDVLYGLSQGYQSNYELYTINQTNGNTTLVGDTGMTYTGPAALAGLTFASDGTLYAVMNNSLYTLNPGNGAPTLVGAIGFNNVSGLTAVIPEPATVVLLGLGALSLIRRKH